MRTKFQLTNIKQRWQNEQGISLLLAILILSTVTTIIFSLVTITLAEIRASQDVLRTEPIVYAALGMTEQQFFLYRRGVSNPENYLNISAPAEFETTGVAVQSTVKQFLPAPQLEVINPGETKSFPLVNPLNPYDFPATPYFSSIGLTNVPNGSNATLQYAVNEYLQSGVNTVDDYRDLAYGASTGLMTSFFGAPNSQHELKLRVPSGSNPVLVSITTRNQSGPDNTGAPSINEKVFVVTAQNRGLTRTYQVRVPLK